METICFFNTAKAWGGGEKWHFEVSRHLHQNGFDVFVVAHEKSALLEKLIGAQIPCKGIAISNLSFINPFSVRQVYQSLASRKIKTIVMNLSRDVKIAGRMAKKAGIPRIIYRRGSAIPIKNTWFNRYLFKNIITEILANSQATKKTILANNANLFDENNINVIHNGIDTGKTVPQAKKNNILTILTLGRLEYQKNHKFLLHLAVALKKRGLQFLIRIGGDGRLKEQLTKMAITLGVGDYIRFDGFIESPLTYINQADIFVLPSRWEGFGYVLAEAALCKKPIVAFDVSSNPELISHGTSGYLLPKDDVNAFADAIIKLDQQPELREAFGRNGHQFVTEHLDQNQQLQKIQDYLVHA
ncbi:Glycosyl transferase group 1 [Croceitalea dokdonensis DOKDO 023]|uniref:Glycosyl transferase group 1 n=1 Tax=Croceitalea dokdonensis DOKDO 023 TaxID=1300341 RepID=A0A0P7AT78_9FLAO|nr:glycosyltransferase [Croceitalea dokdonensis]KPM31615.1 Glycosyl transferase group 1 [Croceitalea dokdonensis DOKDO 023]